KLLEADTSNGIAQSNISMPLKIDANSDGEIQMSEAQFVFGLSIGNSNISSLEGIENFSNLLQIICPNNLLTSVNFLALPNLRNLNCSNNALTSLDLTGQQIFDLNCSNNQINDLIFGGFHVNDNDDPQFGATLNMTNNLLTSLDINSPDENYFLSIDFSDNPLQTVNFSYAWTGTLRCNNTALTTLSFADVSAPGVHVIVTNNPNLQSINFQNGNAAVPNTTFDFSGNPELAYVCVDQIQSEISYFMSLGLNPALYCSLVPTGNFNTITGVATIDTDGNGCDPQDAAASNISVQMMSNVALGNTFTNSAGEFTYYVQNGTFTATPEFSNPYFSLSPPSYTFNFSSSGNTEAANFCVVPNGVHPDLEVTLIPSPAQPGFDASYTIVVKNQGTEMQSGTVNLVFDDAVIDFLSGSPSPTGQTSNNLTWDFADLDSFEMRIYNVNFNINAPTETPPVNIGDILSFTASVMSTNDETPDNNISQLEQVVVGSFDPNDKTVLEGESISVAETDNFLHYVVRFQNTGTAAATQVVIRDMLTDMLDLSTLEMVSSSHSYRATLTNNNKLEFFFENINLPGSMEDEAGSHGYVAFKIKPTSSVGLGDVIENSANIYFDYNFPIETNTTSTTVTQLSTEKFNRDMFSVYPNPAGDYFRISGSSAEEITVVSVYNMFGQVLLTKDNIAAENSVDISTLASGTYLVELHFASNSKVAKKLIKL
ncbi:MAG TPA: T9SS type A sorting domain-containing protein, partial [Flavobacterium sp.]